MQESELRNRCGMSDVGCRISDVGSWKLVEEKQEAEVDYTLCVIIIE